MVQVAILGFGNIGSGIAEVIARGYNMICKEMQDGIHIKYILDLRDFPDHPLGDRVVHDFDVILNDPEVSIVCETMGGTKPAFEYSLACLQAGKSVITSNKEVVATFGNLLCDAARDHGVRYLYEASVGGGIPIIRSIKSSMAGDQIIEICGILNGTTNYILTEMKKSGKTMAEALSEAQALGYAERNPSADIGGDDSTRKICILAALAFGILVSPSMVDTVGIRDITPKDVEIAAKFGAAVKLIGYTRQYPDGRIEIGVCPCLVRGENPISTVDGVFNAIMVKAACLGDVMFYGQGAGSLPTASAILSDIIDVARHLKAGRQPQQESWQVAAAEDVCDPYEVKLKMYAAVSAPSDRVLEVAPGAKILHSDGEITAFLCEDTTRPDFDALLEKIGSPVLSKFRAI